jgi:hypothetical protein
VTTWVYVDETKRAGYVIAAVTVTDPAAVRKITRALVLPGQRRIHMKHEQPRRRRAIVSALTAAGLDTTIYDASRRYRTEHEARTACLTALIEDFVAASGNVRLVIERDDSLVRSDQATLYRVRQRTGLTRTVHYDHEQAAGELLLALPDIVAWCWVRSGDWRRRVSPIISNVRHI